MFSNLFKSNKRGTIREFLNELKSGNRNILQILETKESEFQEASFEELMSNTDDVLAKVNKVQKNFSNVYFNIFTGTLIKHHDNGDVKFVFYTVTADAIAITEFSEVLFSEFGHGIFDDNRFTPFTNKQKIKEIAQGIYFLPKDELLHLWQYENLSFVLQYRIDPPRQFSLMLTVHPPKSVDTAIRRKGTILDLLKIDMDSLLNTEPVHSHETWENGKVKFVDYIYQLPFKELGAFDIVSIRIFDAERKFRKNVQTHITFLSYNPIPAENKIKVAEDLIRIYGNDENSPAELEIQEMEDFEEGGFWLGRSWNFNDRHGLFQFDNGEKMSYQVWLADMQDEEGFKISINSFNELVSLFGID